MMNAMRPRSTLALLPILVAALTASRATAVEIYALYEKGCRVTIGAIVGVEEERAVVLSLDGKLKDVGIWNIDLVARYDVLENPFPRITPGQGHKALLEVTSESSEGSFRAYATNFFEDLVLFLDETAKVRVVEMDEIIAIVRPPRSKSSPKPLAAKPLALVPPPGRAHCLAPQTQGARAATQVMADKLRVDSFWAHMRTGHRDLESLRERTMFYARPLLFDQKTRLGIVVVRPSRREKLKVSENIPPELLPLYLEFGGGSSYRFQSSVSLGTKSWRMAPQVRPISGVRSEFKSHLLHGMFLGNLSGVTAGKPVFTEGWLPDDARNTLWLDSSFNHLTLLGVDYGPWSISYGYYFPTFALGKAGEFREVTGTKASQAARVAIQKLDWQLEVFLFNTSIDDDNDTLDKATEADRRSDSDLFVRYYSTHLVPRKARLTSTTMRVNLSLFPVGELTGYSDLAITQTRYKESALRRDRSIEDWNHIPDSLPDFQTGAAVTNAIEQTSYASRLGARMDLGKWVGLGAQASFEHLETKGVFALSPDAADEKTTDQILTYMAMMELLL